MDKINVLLLAHDGGLGGATSSLLNIVEQFNIDYPEVSCGGSGKCYKSYS